MIESLKDLNQKCQKPRYKEVGNWMVRHIVRDAALPITWALLHTNVTANQVTAASLVLGLFGIFLFSFDSRGLFFIGTLLLQSWYLLDHVDGQIARYRGTASLSGRFFDFITHHIIHGVIFFSLGVYAYGRSGSFFWILWGFASSIMMVLFNLISDTKYKTFVEKLQGGKYKSLGPSGEEEELSRKGGEGSLRKAYSVCHKISENHVLMNILTLGAVLEFFFKFPFDARMIVLFCYGIVVPFLTVTKIAYIVAQKKIDQEFQKRFKEVQE